MSLHSYGHNTLNFVWHTEATKAGSINDYLIHQSTQHKDYLSRCKADMEEGGTSWLYPHLSVGEGRTPFLTSSRSGPATHSSDDPEQESSWPWPQRPFMYNEILDEPQAPPALSLREPLLWRPLTQIQSPPPGCRRSCIQSTSGRKLHQRCCHSAHRPGLTNQPEFSCQPDTPKIT